MPWEALLDALEERNRQLHAALQDRTRTFTVADICLQADGPLPPALALRVRVLLDDTQRLQQALQARHRSPSSRAAAEYASH